MVAVNNQETRRDRELIAEIICSTGNIIEVKTPDVLRDVIGSFTSVFIREIVIPAIKGKQNCDVIEVMANEINFCVSRLSTVEKNNLLKHMLLEFTLDKMDALKSISEKASQKPA